MKQNQERKKEKVIVSYIFNINIKKKKEKKERKELQDLLYFLLLPNLFEITILHVKNNKVL